MTSKKGSFRREHGLVILCTRLKERNLTLCKSVSFHLQNYKGNFQRFFCYGQYLPSVCIENHIKYPQSH